MALGFTSHSPLDRAVPGELVLRRRLLIQLLTFVLLELAFIALAITCLGIPLPCSISSSQTFTKSTFTVLFIAWQTVAIMCAQDIVLHGFSSEWHLRLRETGKLVPGQTDMVSTTTSGLRDRFRYFFSRTSSPSYRLSFFCFWILLAMAGIAPGSINVEELPRFTPATINITNFTATGGNINTVLFNPIVRTDLVVDLELRQNASFKFTTQENIILGWPNVDAGGLTGDIEFESDALLYNITCWWEAPSFNTSQWGTTWYAGGFAWYPWTTPDPSTTFDGGMMPMFRFSRDQVFIPGEFPDTLPVVDPVGLSGYLFFGHNSSFPNTSSKRRNFDLDNLPTILNTSGFHFIGFDNAEAYFKPPLATFLLCDPQARILDGRALLSQANTSLTLLSTSPPANGIPKVGNIPLGAANVVLGLSLMEALENDDEMAPMRIGALASQVFLNDTSLNFDSSPTNPFEVGILSTEEIRRNLNLFMNSGAKALSSYIRDYDVETPDELFLVPVRGAIQQDDLALVASRSLVISTICLFFCALTPLVINLFYLVIWRRPPFKLESLIYHLREKGWEDEKVALSLDQQLHPSHPSHPSLQSLLIRLLGFITFEVAFLVLVLVCSNGPIIVDIPLSSAEVKGGFTVLFILWQALAISLLADVTSFAFSIEWRLQLTKTSLLIPGVTDRVSRLTSGIDDRTRYFFTQRPSITFRVAFLTSLALTALNSFAPGTLSVSKVKTKVDTQVRVADLRLLTSSQDDDNENNLFFLQGRTYDLTLMEHHEDSMFKYDMEPSWMMAWPDESSFGPDVAGNVEYPTDVVRFNYSCEWRVPEMSSDDDGATTWVIDGQSWELWSDPLSDIPYVGGILPLYRYLDMQPDAVSAVLLIGTNSTLPVDPNESKRSIINLDDIPAMFHPSGLTLNTSDSIPSQWVSPLSTVLFCDPHIEVSGGHAQLTPSKKLTVTTSGLPPIGNMPRDAITTIFTQALLEPLDTNDETVEQWIGTLSTRMFLTDISVNLTTFPHGVPIHNLTTLTENFNSFTHSASKAFLDGLYVDPSDQSNITAQTRSVSGLAEVETQALVGDKTLGIVSLCLSVTSVISYGLLVSWMLGNPGEAFNLQNLLPVLHVYPNKINEVNRLKHDVSR